MNAFILFDISLFRDNYCNIQLIETTALLPVFRRILQDERLGRETIITHAVYRMK